MDRTTSDPCATCSHPGYSHSTQGRCLACLKCYAFVWPTRCADAGCGMIHGPSGSPDGYHEVHGPAMVSLTSDQYEGLKAEVSYANSRIEELEKDALISRKVAEVAESRESALRRDNFDLMREKARAESKLACLAGRHGITVGEGDDEQCKECGAYVNDEESWRTRKPVNVFIEGSPPGGFVGPYILVTPEERARYVLNWDKAAELCEGYLDRIEELEALLSTAPDGQREAIEDDQAEQERIEAEQEAEAAKDNMDGWTRLQMYGIED